MTRMQMMLFDHIKYSARLGIVILTFDQKLEVERVLKGRKLALQIRMKIHQCYVWSILRHEAET